MNSENIPNATMLAKLLKIPYMVKQFPNIRREVIQLIMVDEVNGNYSSDFVYPPFKVSDVEATLEKMKTDLERKW